MKCEGVTRPCEQTKGVKEETTRTSCYVGDCGHEDCNQYPELKEACWLDRVKRLNITAWLCRDCAKEFHDYWAAARRKRARWL